MTPLLKIIASIARLLPPSRNISTPHGNKSLAEIHDKIVSYGDQREESERKRCVKIIDGFPLTYMNYTPGVKELLSDFRRRVKEKILASPSGDSPKEGQP